MRKPRPGQIIFIEWQDCFTVDRWTPVAELLQHKSPRISTVGIFAGVSIDRDWVVMTGLTDDGPNTEQHSAATWFIPPAMVRGWHRLSKGVS